MVKTATSQNGDKNLSQMIKIVIECLVTESELNKWISQRLEVGLNVSL